MFAFLFFVNLLVENASTNKQPTLYAEVKTEVTAIAAGRR